MMRWLPASRTALDAASAQSGNAICIDRLTPVEALVRGLARLEDGRFLVNEAGSSAGILARYPAEIVAANVLLASDKEFEAIIRAAIPDAVARYAADNLAAARPGMTARDSKSKLLFVSALALAMIGSLALIAGPAMVAACIGLLLCLLFAASMALTLVSLFESAPLKPPRQLRAEADFPRYCVLVPLCREAAVVPKLIAALRALNYPRERLDVRFIIETDDRATYQALCAEGLADWMRIVIVPPGEPRTKPRALNAAILGLRADYAVVYDAEDEPDPNQLLDAAGAFADAPSDVACLQARLSIDNSYDCVLTRLFTLEYAALFDVFKPGLARLRLPIPLGGTSNHFRLNVLQSIGGWDAWNVTEDADLGIRLARYGYVVADLNSTTYEEAPASFSAWMNQRRRWMKGWMQTAGTHLLTPKALVAEMGVVNAAAAFVQIVSTIAAALGFPFLAGLFALRLVSGGLASDGLLSWVADALAITVFAGGIVCLIVPALIGCMRRGLLPLAICLLLMPLYCLLITAAAWLALGELLRDPFRWNKTSHGHARTSRQRRASETGKHPSMRLEPQPTPARGAGAFRAV